MEVCAPGSISKLTHFRSCKASNHRPIFMVVPRQGLQCLINSEQASTGKNLFVKNEPNSGINLGDRPIVDEKTDDCLAFQEVSPFHLQKQLADFVQQLIQKFESEDSYSIALFGSTVATALYLASAIVSAIDSIPILPKLMEVVGLGYTFWFTSRYLLFKKNRDEFAVKIEELKQHVIGSKNE